MKNTKRIAYRTAACPRYPNQADHNLQLHKILDAAMMFACCAGTVSVFSFLMSSI